LAPVYFYIELDNFFANHRDYTKSRNFEQLRADGFSTSPKNCDGAKYIKEIFDFDESRYLSYNGTKLKGDDLARPCGLHAKAILNVNDTFELHSDTDKFEISEDNIANKYDKENVFGKWDNSSTVDWFDTTKGINLNLFKKFT
jgi:hypothetical protein